MRKGGNQSLLSRAHETANIHWKMKYEERNEKARKVLMIRGSASSRPGVPFVSHQQSRGSSFP